MVASIGDREVELKILELLRYNFFITRILKLVSVVFDENRKFVPNTCKFFVLYDRR